jgi:peptide deformylase
MSGMPSTHGVARPITRYGEPVLHRRCAEVTSFDHELVDLIEEMFVSMYAAEGAGLAANQIGVGLRVFVYDCPDADGIRRIGHVVNPVLHHASELSGLSTDNEGCLSVPGPRAEVSRPAIATVTGQDRHGRPLTISGTGYFARCLQHETEHLDGIVYVDKLPAPQRAALLTEAGLPV